MMILEALLYAIEWRVIAFLLTLGVLYLLNKKIGQATREAIIIHAILFFFQWIWFFFRVVIPTGAS